MDSTTGHPARPSITDRVRNGLARLRAGHDNAAQADELRAEFQGTTAYSPEILLTKIR